ncbi:hypothetical protein [Streptomyces sp. NPDC051997]|uniref:hypothetical protein n=1 Tax=Streptomyces sp. NPDC051997 TaxID=3155611 RepID=UPI00344AD4FC
MTGPEHYTRAEQLLREVRDGHQEGTDVAAILAAAQVHATLALATAQSQPAPGAQLETEPAVAFVYRAAWGDTPLGTYTISDAAREHCEADALNHAPEFEGGIFEWLGDESEPDDPHELLVAKDGTEQMTEYTVTRITVATEYDPEADA